MHITICKDVNIKECALCKAKGNMKLAFDKNKQLVPVCHDWRECRKRIFKNLSKANT